MMVKKTTIGVLRATGGRVCFSVALLPYSEHVERVGLWLHKEVYPDFASPRVAAPIEPEIPDNFDRSPRTESSPQIATSDPYLPTSPFDKIRLVDDAGEYWSARDMSPMQGYVEWRNFDGVIAESMTVCKSNGHNVSDHFVKVNKMIPLGKGGQRRIDDYRLSRYACYLIAMAGDGNKPEVAAARNYFAIRPSRG
jgi:hypothetical protein